MRAYLLSVFGIVLAGVILDVVLPAGSINKYIKSIYSIFVVFVLINPIFSFLKQERRFLFTYQDYQLDEKLMEYVYTKRTEAVSTQIANELKKSGITDVDINLKYSIENNELIYNSCLINLDNMTITEDKQHINIYEFITEILLQYTNLSEQEIVFYGG